MVLMTIIHALILGIVQGVAEMLPISSSAHLVLVPWFLNFPDPGLAFDVALHLGTLVAVLVYFWHDWIELLLAFIGILKTRKIETFQQKLILFLLVASIPGAVFGYLLESKAETVFRNPLLVAFMLTILGIVLLIGN
jgi:undecaprenyl-diphosphatase